MINKLSYVNIKHYKNSLFLLLQYHLIITILTSKFPNWHIMLIIPILSDCNWTRTHNHLVHKRTINDLAKLAKWLSCVVSTYLYGAFDYMFLSCHIRIQSESTVCIIWLVWPNGWVFVYELSGCGFGSSCSHLNFGFRACFDQGVPRHSGNYRAWIHSECLRDIIKTYSHTHLMYAINSKK